MARRKEKDRIDELEDRIQAIEDVFAPRIISRQSAHVEATKNDAREVLDVGDVKTIEITEPPGEGDAPESGVGKIDGIVTFVNCDGLDVENDDVLHCRITHVSPNAANAVATQKAEYQ